MNQPSDRGGPASLLPPRSRRIAHIARRRVSAFAPGTREAPTYFIVGAKRAGTTSLDEYLVAHPLVMRGLVEKGCRYYDVNYDRGERWWRSHLPSTASIDRAERRLGGRPIFGESSPYYAFHPQAAARIAADHPQARIIFVLRDPVERAWSHYRYELAREFETLEPMAALEAETRRLADPDPRVAMYAHRHFSYLARSRYAEQVARLHSHFDPEQVLLVASERIFTDPHATMERVFAHVGLSPHEGIEYRPHKALRPEPVLPEFRDRIASGIADDLLELRRLVPDDWPW